MRYPADMEEFEAPEAQRRKQKKELQQNLDSFYGREPCGCAVVVVSREKPVRFDGGYIPSIARVERCFQLFLTDRVRASFGTIVTEAQHVTVFHHGPCDHTTVIPPSMVSA